MVSSIKLSSPFLYAGKEFTATVLVQPLDGGSPPTGVIKAKIDFGSEMPPSSLLVSLKEGKGLLELMVPSDATTMNPTLEVSIELDGIVIPTYKTLTIYNPKLIVVDFFPEGGFSVPGEEIKVYFQAWMNAERSLPAPVDGKFSIVEKGDFDYITRYEGNFGKFGRGVFTYTK